MKLLKMLMGVAVCCAVIPLYGAPRAINPMTDDVAAIVGGACGATLGCSSSTNQPCSDGSGNYCSCNVGEKATCSAPQTSPCLNGAGSHCFCPGYDQCT